MFPPKSPEENPSFLLPVSGVASNPWYSLVYIHIIPISASVVIWPSALCVPPFSSLLRTLVIRLTLKQADLKILNSITSAKILYSNKVTSTGSGWTCLLRHHHSIHYIPQPPYVLFILSPCHYHIWNVSSSLFSRSCSESECSSEHPDLVFLNLYSTHCSLHFFTAYVHVCRSHLPTWF